MMLHAIMRGTASMKKYCQEILRLKKHPNKTTLNQITYSVLFVQYSVNVLF